jgi:hypothetical protein
VLEGEFTVWAGGRKAVLRPGDDIVIPAATAHAVHATGDGPARGLVLASPSGFARLITEVGTPDEGGEAPGTPAVVDFADLWLATCRLAEACGCKPPSGVGWPWDERRDPPPKFLLRVRASACGTEARAVRYLAKCKAAVSGQGGHAKSFFAARAVVWGFDLGAEVGFRLLKEHFNPRCNPKWSDKDLWHKCQAADRLPYKHPRDYLRDAPFPKAQDNGATRGRRAASRRGRHAHEVIKFKVRV